MSPNEYESSVKLLQDRIDKLESDLKLALDVMSDSADRQDVSELYNTIIKRS